MFVDNRPECKKGIQRGVIEGNVDSKFLCGHCTFVLRSPQQAQCGHRFCELCILFMLSQALRVLCPVCLQDSEEEDIIKSEVFPDRALMREFRTLPARCINAGCSWKAPFSEYQDHEKICEFIPVVCKRCTKEFPKCQIESHECRLPECEFVNCDKQLSPEEIQKHEKESAIPHLRGVNTAVTRLTELTSRMTSQISAIEASVGSPEASEGAATNRPPIFREVATLTTTVESLDEVLKALKVEVQQHSRRHQDNELQLNQMRVRLTQQEDKVKVLEGKLQSQETFIANLAPVSTSGSGRMDGTLLWRILDFRTRMQEARRGSTSYLDSPPFFTDPAGYKLGCRLYPFGDGMGKSTHISLFIYIMAGEYDAIQRWPFTHKVTMKVKNPRGGEDVEDAFLPDSTSSSFQRPRTARNLASGAPLFMPLGDVERYLGENGELYVKVIVDRAGLR